MYIRNAEAEQCVVLCRRAPITTCTTKPSTRAHPERSRARRRRGSSARRTAASTRRRRPPTASRQRTAPPWPLPRATTDTSRPPPPGSPRSELVPETLSKCAARVPRYECYGAGNPYEVALRAQVSKPSALHGVVRLLRGDHRPVDRPLGSKISNPPTDQ